jgi:predicted glycoside hydrolase/deacetylase ChbG (UPF0249 family)
LAVDEVAREFRAQWDWFVAAAGRAPDHLDAHHHIAYRHPGALAVLLDLAEEHGVPVRGVGADAASREELVADLPPETRAEASAALREVWERQRAPLRPAHFIASFYGAGATLAHLRELLAGLPAGVSELMCHPGYVDADLQSDYTAAREVELRILTDPRVREQVVAEGIELIAFGALR